MTDIPTPATQWRATDKYQQRRTRTEIKYCSDDDTLICHLTIRLMDGGDQSTHRASSYIMRDYIIIHCLHTSNISLAALSSTTSLSSSATIYSCLCFNLPAIHAGRNFKLNLNAHLEKIKVRKILRKECHLLSLAKLRKNVRHTCA